MSNITTSSIELVVSDNKVTTTSNKIAEVFNKRHDNVLNKIETLECSPEFRLLNFKETVWSRPNPSGDTPIQSKAYEITRDGFVFVAMGFTGKKAAEFKEAYINAFNEMEAKLVGLTPEQQHHIQCRVKELTDTQIGTTFQALYKSIKDQFKVGTYKDIPTSRYSELCEFLGCEPLEGEWIPNDTPQSGRYDMPADYLAQFRNGVTFTQVNYHMLNDQSIEDPVLALFKKLTDDGYDIEAAEIFYLARCELLVTYFAGLASVQSEAKAALNLICSVSGAGRREDKWRKKTKEVLKPGWIYGR